jgi:hypothetical protein
MDEVSGVICFLLCARKDDPLPPLHNPHPFPFSVSALMSGNAKNGRRSK